MVETGADKWRQGHTSGDLAQQPISTQEGLTNWLVKSLPYPLLCPGGVGLGVGVGQYIDRCITVTYELMLFHFTVSWVRYPYMAWKGAWIHTNSLDYRRTLVLKKYVNVPHTVFGGCEAKCKCGYARLVACISNSAWKHSAVILLHVPQRSALNAQMNATYVFRTTLQLQSLQSANPWTLICTDPLLHYLQYHIICRVLMLKWCLA